MTGGFRDKGQVMRKLFPRLDVIVFLPRAVSTREPRVTNTGSQDAGDVTIATGDDHQRDEISGD